MTYLCVVLWRWCERVPRQRPRAGGDVSGEGDVAEAATQGYDDAMTAA